VISFARLYKPACGVTIAGFPVTSLGIPGVVDARIAFRVRRSLSSTPDSAQVTVWGLDPTQRLAMQTVWSELGKAKLLIASGYDGVTAQLFAGDVRTLKASVRIGPEWATTVTGDDGGDALADATITVSTAGLNAQNMIDLALAALTLADPVSPIVAHPSVAATIASATPGSTTLFYGSVSVGKAKDLLDEAARTLGARWWIRDGQLFMLRRRAPVPGPAILLPRTHWLDEPSEDGNGLISVSTYLDPNITPGCQIMLVGRTALADREACRVEACEYTGDNDSASPFRCDLEARRLL
jgi:hypothetical protein